MSEKTALITGITSMDGSYLAEHLLEKGYTVYGIMSRRAVPTTRNIDHIINKLKIIKADMTDAVSLRKAVEESKPDEVYNLAAQSFVKDSWDIPEYTLNVNAVGVQRLLEAVYNTVPHAKFYQAGSSEQFGLIQEIPQRETTPFYPRSPYGVSKLTAHWLCTNYRESYNKFICCGILFNHTSPRRGEQFVEQKIVKTAVEIYLHKSKELRLGNLDAKRDFGHSKDYTYGMWLMLQQEQPDDYVLAMNETHSIREVLDVVFGYLKLDWTKYVIQDPKFLRPSEVDLLLGDSTKAREKLGWTPTYTFESILKEMVDVELSRHN